MLEQIEYINHLGESISLNGLNGIFVNYNDLHDYSWDYTSYNNKISSFDKGVVSKTIPIIICCSSDDEGLELRNQLMEIAEKDVLAVEHGKIWIGDYYLKCYITASSKSNYLMRKGYMETSLTVISDYPQWIKETTTSFTNSATVGQSSGFLDYPYDFTYDYLSTAAYKILSNDGYVESNFRIIIYGPVSNPIIYIDDHAYQVNVTVESGEYLTIDSLLKTIVLTETDGTETNVFNYRNRDSYIFEPIAVGNNEVAWDNTFIFDIILLEERSEPEWT